MFVEAMDWLNRNDFVALETAVQFRGVAMDEDQDKREFRIISPVR